MARHGRAGSRAARRTPTSTAALALAERRPGGARSAVRENEVRLAEAKLTLGRGCSWSKDKLVDAGRGRRGAGGGRLARRAHRRRRASRSRVAERQIELERTNLDNTDHPRAVQRRGDLEGCAAGRDGVAGVGRRRLHADRHLHDRRHAIARGRGRRQRELHQPRETRPGRHGRAQRVSRLADSGARHHDGAGGRPPEGTVLGAHRLQGSSIRGSCRTWA